ncbi:hypothetical protein [Streptomyces sp. NBC_01233]|nr:hypothetical protein OG332_14225 [Streptomyces sp. NBC_01233]
MKRIPSLARMGMSVMPSPVPRRRRRLSGRHALVDDIPFDLPVD